MIDPLRVIENHEAAHATVAYLLGFPMLRATIDPLEYDHARGCVRVNTEKLRIDGRIRRDACTFWIAGLCPWREHGKGRFLGRPHEGTPRVRRKKS